MVALLEGIRELDKRSLVSPSDLHFDLVVQFMFYIKYTYLVVDLIFDAVASVILTMSPPLQARMRFLMRTTKPNPQVHHAHPGQQSVSRTASSQAIPMAL